MVYCIFKWRVWKTQEKRLATIQDRVFIAFVLLFRLFVRLGGNLITLWLQVLDWHKLCQGHAGTACCKSATSTLELPL